MVTRGAVMGVSCSARQGSPLQVEDTGGQELVTPAILCHKDTAPVICRSFLCMEANYPYPKLWMPELVLYGIRDLV